MTYDIKIKQDKVYLIEKDENLNPVKKQRKIFLDAEKNLRKILTEKINGKSGEC